MGKILSKPEYIGHTVNFRSHKESYKDKGSVPNPQEEWLIFENTHEAIIDKETWELVQKLRKTPRRKDTLGEANPLTGLVFCADCGAKMYNHRFKGDLDVIKKKLYESFAVGRISEVRFDNLLAEYEKKLLQAKQRLEEAQMRDRQKERKARTRRLIQEGAILEKALPQTTQMTLEQLEDFLCEVFNPIR